MMKLSHKALKEMGKSLGGYFFDSNIYAHENRVHYATSIVCSWRQEERIAEAKAHCSEMANLIDDVMKLGADNASCEQLAYSCGYYGNSGQLHKITYYKGDSAIRTIFLYC